MKKIFLVLATLATLMVSNSALAAFTLNGGTNDYRLTDCSLLANDIDIVLTSNVIGGVQCDTANNFIALSVCHTSGLVTERSAVVLDTNGDGTQDCTVTETEDCVQTVSGAQFPTATTANGTVTSQYPQQTCNATNVEGNADAQTAPQ